MKSFALSLETAKEATYINATFSVDINLNHILGVQA